MWCWACNFMLICKANCRFWSIYTQVEHGCKHSDWMSAYNVSNDSIIKTFSESSQANSQQLSLLKHKILQMILYKLWYTNFIKKFTIWSWYKYYILTSHCMVFYCVEHLLYFTQSCQHKSGVVYTNKTITLQSGAKINISDASCPERIVTVTGTAEQLNKAFDLICTKFEEIRVSFIQK